MNHNWWATKQRLHPQSVAEISRHSVLSGDRIRQRGTSSGSRFCRHCRVPVPCENGSAETTVAEGGRNPAAGLWDRTLGENWPPEPTSSYASIDFWCQLVASPGCPWHPGHPGFLDVNRSNGGLRISGSIGQLLCLIWRFSPTACQWQPSFVGHGSMLESTGSHGRGVERRVPEMRRMIEFNCTKTKQYAAHFC